MVQVAFQPSAVDMVEGPAETCPSPDTPYSNVIKSLDALLERYLELLDQHQQLQKELGKMLASVCLFSARLFKLPVLLQDFGQVSSP